MSEATGRWTGIARTPRKVGADPVVVVVNGPEQKSGWKTVLILAAVAAGIYVLTPTATYYYKHGHLPDHPDDCHHENK